MCNISFIRNKKGLSQVESAAFKWLLAANSVQNSDGVGFFDGDKIYRSILSAKEYFLQESHDFMGKEFILAHTRRISRGTRDLKHTHPFYSGNFVVVHNGTMTMKGEKPEDYCDSEIFTEALAASVEETIVGKLQDAFNKFEHGTYAIMFYSRGQVYLLTGKNTVHSFIAGDTLWINTDKGRLDSVKYFLQMAGEKYVTETVQVPVGLFHVPLDSGGLDRVPETENKLFLSEPKYQTTTVWSPGSYRVQTAQQKPERKVKFIPGEEKLSEYIESLPVTDLSTVVKILGEKYTQEELYEMLQMHPDTFCTLIKGLLAESKIKE